MESLWPSVKKEAGPELALLKEITMKYLQARVVESRDATDEWKAVNSRANLLAAKYMIETSDLSMKTFQLIVELGLKMGAKIVPLVLKSVKD